MSDEQIARVLLSIAFNAPTAILAVAYAVMTAITYRRYRDQRALRMFAVSLGLAAGVGAYWTLILGTIVSSQTLPFPILFAFSLFRLVVFAVLATVVYVWWRHERRGPRL